MFSQDVTNALFANGGNKGASANLDKLKRRVAATSEAYQNDDQPLAEAQRISDLMMASKQRRPMTFEYETSSGKWTTLTMYINPQRLSMQTQKIKSKAVTRGGIFYHHWGDDHWAMSLSGTTGLSGMKGIQHLENLYKASGLLLKYKKYTVDNGGPDLEVGAYKTIDYNDSVSVLEAATSTTNPTTLGKIRAEHNHAEGHLKKVTDQLLKVIDTNLKAQVKSSKFDTINSQLDDYYTKSKQTRVPTSSEYYNNALSVVRKTLGTSATSDVVVALAYQKTMEKYSDKSEEIVGLIYKSAVQANNNTALDTAFQTALNSSSASNKLTYGEKVTAALENLESRAVYINDKRAESLRAYMSEIADWTQRELEIKNQLKVAVESTDLFGDEWAPRRIIMYYENRAYIGHFDMFSYQRSADSPLITYEMRFTVEKTIVGTLL